MSEVFSQNIRVQMEKYVESFLASEITLDILPLVSGRWSDVVLYFLAVFPSSTNEKKVNQQLLQTPPHLV